MVKITKRIVETAEAREKDYVIWDDELPGFGLRVCINNGWVSVKTKKLRGKAVVRGGAGTATRTVGLLSGMLTYAIEAGIIGSNPAHDIHKPKDNVRKRRLSRGTRGFSDAPLSGSRRKHTAPSR
jgi:hypothetical protein